MTFTSFAQNFEDVMLWRALKNVEDGFYIDIGANDPSLYSVTRAFYDRGWRGINVEPSEMCFEKLAEVRARDINIKSCVGSTNGEGVLFDIHGSGLSTMNRQIAETHRMNGWDVRSETVDVVTLNKICEAHASRPIHFLKVDVEGAEAEVLSGIDFKLWRPWIVVVEATVPGSSEPNYVSWEHYLLSNQYLFAYFDGLNRFYVAEEQSQLVSSFSVPPNVFDEFVTDRSISAYENQQAKEKLVSRLSVAQAELRSSEDKIRQTEEQLRGAKGELADTKLRLDQTVIERNAVLQRAQIEKSALDDLTLIVDAQTIEIRRLETALANAVLEMDRLKSGPVVGIASFLRKVVFCFRKPRTASLVLLSIVQRNPRRLRRISRALDNVPSIKRRLGAFARRNTKLLSSIRAAKALRYVESLDDPEVYRDDVASLEDQCDVPFDLPSSTASLLLRLRRKAVPTELLRK